ncbi:MAG TPA: AraC family transcriptional regulator [Limnochordia bacterium]|jgi:AraC-type DNA-binding domain-containing proteins|nr:AraC family transcriptional regulator [Limnochordia bacterium]
MPSQTVRGLSIALETEREAYQRQANIEELIERIGAVLSQDGGAEPIPGLRLHRVSRPTQLHHGVYEPSFCVIAQGSKEVFLGRDRYRYDPAHYLLATLELPVRSHVTTASPEKPYLSFSLRLDPAVVSSVMVESGTLIPRGSTEVRAMDVSRLDEGLLDAVVRLARLIDSPADADFLAPLITREIVYRLLKGQQGARLCYIATRDGHVHRIARAIEKIRHQFDQPFSAESMAQELGMSVSSFYRHFKAVTAMTPLQFQKQLRLQEARRLMLSENLDATSAAFRVGYSDASHFNREYKRLFGLPPFRDIERLKKAARSDSAPF